MIDPVTNFARITPELVDDIETTINIGSGEGALLPDPSTDGAFNLPWWNFTDYKVASDDPNKEIVRCTARTGDQLTVVRAQEGTAATVKNLTGKIYKMGLARTAKFETDLKKYVPGLEDYKTIVSSATTSIGALASSLVSISGTIAITSFGSADAGVIRFVKFTSSIVLTHNGTSLMLPDSENITTEAGDKAVFVSLGSGNWECLMYQITKASQSDAETGENDTKFMTSLKTKQSIYEKFTFGETIAAGDALSVLKLDKTSAVDVPTTADTYVDQDNAAVNYNSATAIQLSDYNFNPPYPNKYGYLRFDSGFPSDMKAIISFDLVINVVSGATATGSVTVHPVSSSWNAGTITYNDQPSVGSSIGSVSVTTNGLKTISISVANGTISDQIINNGIRLTGGGQTGFLINIDSLETVSGTPCKINNLVYGGYDGKVHKVNSSYQASDDNFAGFAIESGVLDDEKFVQSSGVLKTTGLSAGVSNNYGRALTATQFLIIPPNN
jgi:hypothetical protein